MTGLETGCRSLRASLERTTERFIQQIVQSNPGTRIISQQQVKVSGREAMLTTLSAPSVSPTQKEINSVYTVVDGWKLFYAVFVHPEQEQALYEGTFREMIDSIRFQ